MSEKLSRTEAMLLDKLTRIENLLLEFLGKQGKPLDLFQELERNELVRRGPEAIREAFYAKNGGRYARTRASNKGEKQ